MEDLKSGIERLKQAKTLISKANGIMSNHISKLKALEEENARLAAELDDWKGNAEGFQPDAYMKLPLDADGVPIHIGEEMNVDGKCLIVIGYEMQESKLHLLAREDGAYLWTLDPAKYKHVKHGTAPVEPPDSWEKLEKDAKQRVCSYFGIDQENTSCEDCPHGSSQTGRICWRNASLDMIARAKKLAGVEEEGQR